MTYGSARVVPITFAGLLISPHGWGWTDGASDSTERDAHFPTYVGVVCNLWR